MVSSLVMTAWQENAAASNSPGEAFYPGWLLCSALLSNTQPLRYVATATLLTFTPHSWHAPPSPPAQTGHCLPASRIGCHSPLMVTLRTNVYTTQGTVNSKTNSRQGRGVDLTFILKKVSMTGPQVRGHCGQEPCAL